MTHNNPAATNLAHRIVLRDSCKNKRCHPRLKLRATWVLTSVQELCKMNEFPAPQIENANT